MVHCLIFFVMMFSPRDLDLKIHNCSFQGIKFHWNGAIPPVYCSNGDLVVVPPLGCQNSLDHTWSIQVSIDSLYRYPTSCFLFLLILRVLVHTNHSDTVLFQEN